ncbi:MAG: HlyD family secretion protein [Bacteroidetes bacterium]|nr:HlyD family secretion protein [Bacteroidota bacterium]
MEQTTTPAPANTKKKLILPIILGLVIAGGAAFGIKEYLYYSHNADTDDAHVDADISPVIARVAGYVTSVRFSDNQHVTAGDTLVTIDGRELAVRNDQAMGALASAEAAVTTSQAGVASAEASLDVARAAIAAAKARVMKAENDLKRIQALRTSGASTQQQIDDLMAERGSASAQLQGAQAQLVVLQRQLETAKDQVVATTTALAVKKADVEFARLQTSYTALIAPASGVVNKRTVQPGQLIQAGQTVVSVISDSTVYVTANFKETQLERMKVGLPVDIDVDAYPDHVFHGTIASFSPGTGSAFSLLPADNASGNFVKVVQRVPVKIAITHSEGGHMLKPGMNVKAVVHLD